MSNIIYDLNEISQVVGTIFSKVNNKIIAFYGKLGSGKTTLIRHLIKELESQDLGNSPTFGLVNEYRNAKNQLISYNFD